LAATLAKRDEARKISLSLKESYGTLSKRVEDMEEDSPKRTELEFEQALLGVELAKKVQHEIQLERTFSMKNVQLDWYQTKKPKIATGT
jgi:hypothetical protein